MTERLGFKGGIWSPCLFVHEEKDIRAFVYGDNFTTLAERKEQKWFMERLSKHMWAKKEGELGPSEEDDHECVCLNKIIRWNRATATEPEAIDIEADARHVEILPQSAGLKSTSKSV
eukprot:5860914-Amphidinium_carterae.1